MPVERIPLELRERVARLELVVLVELERAAEQLVPAGLGLHRHDAGGRLPELRVVVLRGDLRFPIDSSVGIDDDDAQDGIAVLRAVELVTRAAEVLAVDHRLGGALRVFARRVLPLKLLRARRQQDELREVAIEHRQVGDLLRIEVVETSARSVFSSGEPPVTSTCSVS